MYICHPNAFRFPAHCHFISGRGWSILPSVNSLKTYFVLNTYPLDIKHSHGKSQFLIGKPSIHGQFSMAMINNQRVIQMATEIQVFRCQQTISDY